MVMDNGDFRAARFDIMERVEAWRNGLARRSLEPQVAGSNPAGPTILGATIDGWRWDTD